MKEDNYEKIISPQTAYQLTSILQGVVERGTGKKLKKLGLNLAGKTGTTNNGNDNWFIGYDGKELLMTWVGIESGRNNKENLNLYGSNSAFLVFKDYFMDRGKLFNEMVCR